MKKIILPLILCLLSANIGCGIIKIEEGEKTPIAYTILGREEIPEDLDALIEKKKKSEFQMTYQDENELYLVKGYGQQLNSGYSIQIEELGAVKNAIYFKTQLLGPETKEFKGIPSYPCIVVRIKYQKSPVIFQ